MRLISAPPHASARTRSATGSRAPSDADAVVPALDPLEHHWLRLGRSPETPAIEQLAYAGPVEAFLDRTALAALEVWADGREAEAWLAERGFRRAPSGAWRRTVARGEKMRLLPEMTRALGPGLRNVNARDLEGLELARPRERA
jgi:hypothetical protein